MQPERVQYLKKERYINQNAATLSSVTVLVLRSAEGPASDSPDKLLSDYTNKK